MTIRRLPHVLVALATLVAPLAVLAQPAGDGSVTTAPLATAPAMGMPLLFLLALALAGIAAYRLRPAAGRAIAVVGFVAVLVALAGRGYAPISMMIIKVEGLQCAMQTTQMFNPMARNTLVSHCPNAIQIISIQPGMACDVPCVLVSPCRVGQVLTNNDVCDLPACESAG